MTLRKLEKVLGYEKQFFTIHVGHFLLVTELLSSLKPDGRVVVLSSVLHCDAPKKFDFSNLDGSKSYTNG